MHPDDDKKVFYDKEEIDTVIDTVLSGKTGFGSAYPSMMGRLSELRASKDYKYSLGEWRVDVRLNEDVLLEAFRSIAFEEPNDLAKTLIEYYYESKHKPEGERITLLEKKLEVKYNIYL